MKTIISPKNTEVKGEFLKIYGAGKFQEESMVVNKDQALLLIVDLYEYLDSLKEKPLKLPLGNLHISKGKILYTEKEVYELTKEAVGLWRNPHNARLYRNKEHHGEWWEKIKKK